MTSAIALLLSFLASSALAVVVPLIIFIPTVWFALGLRRDDRADEVADRYIATGRRVRLVDMLTGQFESERRWSTDMLFANAMAILVGAARYIWGWDPLR